MAESMKREAQPLVAGRFTDIEEAKFYCLNWDNGRFKPYNIFDSLDVKIGLALYRTGNIPEDFFDDTGRDWFSYIFARLRGNANFEYLVTDKFEQSTTEVNLYQMIEPNKEIIKQIVDSVTIGSCRRFLKER